MRSVSTRQRVALLLLSMLVLAAAAPASSAAVAGTTSLGFEHSVLDNLGIVAHGASTATPVNPDQMGFAHRPESDLLFFAPGGDIENFASGSLRHGADLVLSIGGIDLDLGNFELRITASPLEMDLFDAAGARWLLLQNPQPRLADGALHLDNIDINIAPELANLLQRPELAGSYLGQADLVIPLPPAGVPAADTDNCQDIFTADRDVALTAIGTVSQLAREPGGRVALTFAAKLSNVGTSAILWKRSIEPDSTAENVGEHPFLSLQVYRMLDGKITQIGQSDVKHAFFATNTGCDCPGAQIIYPGCDDTYGANTNANRKFFAPREEVTVSTGMWSRVGSHFDATPVDDFRDHGGDEAHDLFEHRLLVDEGALQTGGSYFVDAWYIIPDDVDLFNSMARIPVSPALADNTWTFVELGPLENGSVLDEFVDPAAPGPGSASDLLDTGEGRLQLAVKTTELGGGQVHYEYALRNFDFDRQIDSFSIPLPAGVAAYNVDFSDIDTDAGNDWTVEISAQWITWRATAGNELDWGNLYRFGFDADAGPVAATAEVTPLEPGTTETFALSSLAPGVAVVVDNLDANTSRSGRWRTSSGTGPWAGGSVYNNSGNFFRWWPSIPQAGNYRVYTWFTPHPNRSSNVPYRIAHAGTADPTEIIVDQTDALLASRWHPLGIFPFEAGSGSYVEVSSDNGQASADAVRLEYLDADPMPLSVATASLADAVVGQYYSQKLEATGGQPPYTWSLIDALPQGLDLDAITGEIFGTPLGSGSTAFTVEVADDAGTTAQGLLQIAVTELAANIIVDNLDPDTERSGRWRISSGPDPWAGESRYNNGGNYFRWLPLLPRAGVYNVYAWFTYHENRSSNVPYRILHAGSPSPTEVVVDQSDPALASRWYPLGTFSFNAGNGSYVEVSSDNGQASADAVWLEWVGPGP